MRWLLVLLCAATAAGLPATGARGLPGVSKGNKSSASGSLRLFRMRNVMAAWYCAPGEGSSPRAARAPCVNLFDYENDMPPRSTVLDDYKEMYRVFCAEATAHKHHGDICSDPLMRKTYGGHEEL